MVEAKNGEVLVAAVLAAARDVCDLNAFLRPVPLEERAEATVSAGFGEESRLNGLGNRDPPAGWTRSPIAFHGRSLQGGWRAQAIRARRTVFGPWARILRRMGWPAKEVPAEAFHSDASERASIAEVLIESLHGPVEPAPRRLGNARSRGGSARSRPARA